MAEKLRGRWDYELESECDCTLEKLAGGTGITISIFYCPMHKAAPEMLAELEELYSGILASIESAAAASADEAWLAIVGANRGRIAERVAQARGKEVGA